MTRTASAHGLTHEPARTWLENAPCKAEPDAMFPGTLSHEIEHAKSYCRTCPAVASCLEWALDTNQQHGVWGGLTEDERRSRRRQKARAARTTPRKQTGPKPPPAKTLEEAFTRRTQPTDDGHVLWQGFQQFKFHGQPYNPLHVAFQLGHGRAPEGIVLRTCGLVCVKPEHLTDAVMRDAEELCGTRKGYYRHRKRGEDACERCKRANTDTEKLFRHTGTTKAAV